MTKVMTEEIREITESLKDFVGRFILQKSKDETENNLKLYKNEHN